MLKAFAATDCIAKNPQGALLVTIVFAKASTRAGSACICASRRTTTSAASASRSVGQRFRVRIIGSGKRECHGQQAAEHQLSDQVHTFHFHKFLLNYKCLLFLFLLYAQTALQPE